MMMALGTFQPRAEKDLAEHRGEVRGLAAIPVHHGRAVAMIRAFREEDFTRELVVRLVLPETLAQPLIEDEDALHANAVGIRTQQVGPLVRPVIGVLGAGEQAVNKHAAGCRQRGDGAVAPFSLSPFLPCFLLIRTEELPHFLRRR